MTDLADEVAEMRRQTRDLLEQVAALARTFADETHALLDGVEEPPAPLRRERLATPDELRHLLREGTRPAIRVPGEPSWWRVRQVMHVAQNKRKLWLYRHSHGWRDLILHAHDTVPWEPWDEAAVDERRGNADLGGSAA